MYQENSISPRIVEGFYDGIRNGLKALPLIPLLIPSQLAQNSDRPLEIQLNSSSHYYGDVARIPQIKETINSALPFVLPEITPDVCEHFFSLVGTQKDPILRNGENLESIALKMDAVSNYDLEPRYKVALIEGVCEFKGYLPGHVLSDKFTNSGFFY